MDRQLPTANRQRRRHWTDDFFETEFGRVIATRSAEMTQQEVEFIVEKTGLSPGANVLDACCGYGRHSIELARRGYEVVGIDRFESYLNEARKRAASEDVEVEFVSMDVRELSFERKFDLVINMWTSFGVFDDETNASIVQKFKDCLIDGGKLFIELINRDWIIKNFQPRGWWPGDEDLIVIEERSFDLSTSVISSIWRYLEGGELREESPMELRVYSCHELTALLRNCGFCDVEAFGDVEGGPVTFDSRMMRLVAARSWSTKNAEGHEEQKVTAKSEDWIDEFFGEELAGFHRDISLSITRKQVDFVLERTDVQEGARVLDVCCGFGRHSLELARRGFEVVGIDLNETYLAEARLLAEQENLAAEFVQMDVRELSLERGFDLAINLWTSFGYYDDATNASILNKIGQCLITGGKFLIRSGNA